TPLHWAVKKGHSAAIKFVLKAGAQIESRYMKGRTPLAWADRRGHTAGVRPLLDNGA
ncbi:hypothetical protein B0T22DRAFT_344449, partial [Podospora appendiculata]